MRISLEDARKAFTAKWNTEKIAGINFKEKAYCLALGKPLPPKASKTGSKGSKAVRSSTDPWEAVRSTLKVLGEQINTAQIQSGISGASSEELLAAYKAKLTEELTPRSTQTSSGGESETGAEASN